MKVKNICSAPTRVILTSLLAIVFTVPLLSCRDERGGRIGCFGNMFQIGLGVQAYAKKNNGAFPVELVDLTKMENGLPAESQVWGCRGRSDQAMSVGNCDFIYVTGLRSDVSSPATTILLYDKVGGHNNWTNVLFVDGHVKGYVGTSIETIAHQNGLILTYYQKSNPRR